MRSYIPLLCCILCFAMTGVVQGQKGDDPPGDSCTSERDAFYKARSDARKARALFSIKCKELAQKKEFQERLIIRASMVIAAEIARMSGKVAGNLMPSLSASINTRIGQMATGGAGGIAGIRGADIVEAGENGYNAFWAAKPIPIRVPQDKVDQLQANIDAALNNCPAWGRAQSLATVINVINDKLNEIKDGWAALKDAIKSALDQLLACDENFDPDGEDIELPSCSCMVVATK